MTQKERNMAVTLGGMAALMVTGYVGYSFYDAITEHDSTIARLEAEIETSRGQIKTVVDGRPILNHWKEMSLPSDIEIAKGQYRQYLDDLVRSKGMLVESFPDNQSPTKSTIALQNKGTNVKLPIYTGLVFNFRVKCRMTGLVGFLEAFQKQPTMHRIKSLVIERPDSSSTKKEPEMLNVAVTIEAIVILDADKDKLKKKSAAEDRRFVSAEVLETIGGLRRAGMGASPGLALMGWAISPWGPYLQPLNPLKTPERNYYDIVERNPFVDASGFVATQGSLFPVDDLMVNKMRFNRFIGLTMEQRPSGRWDFEARLWDLSKNTKLRVKSSNAFNKIPLVQTAPILSAGGRQNTLLRGVVAKIEDRKLIMRVAFNSFDAERPTWWNYPDDGFAYRLSPDDRRKVEDRDPLPVSPDVPLAVIGGKSWENFVKRGGLTFNNTTKAFQFLTDGSRGYVHYQDSNVMVVQFTVLPFHQIKQPSLALTRFYPDKDRIYDISPKHFDRLLADSKLQSKLPVKMKSDDIDRTYVFDEGYWDWLYGDKLITTQSNGSKFYMYHQLIRGDVLQKKDGVVVVRLDEKYCHCPGDDNRGIKAVWHEGFCVLRLDGLLADALLEPVLSSTEVHELLKLSTGL